MKFIVKVFDLNGQEMELENMIGEEKEVAFEDVKVAEAFIEGIKFKAYSLTFQYKIIPKEEKS